MRSPFDISLGRSLRDILNDVWDPLGVRTYDVLDEYDRYIWPLLALLRSEPPPAQQDVVEALLDIEKGQMGGDGNPDRAAAVARAMLIQSWRPEDYRDLTPLENAVIALLLGAHHPDLHDEFLDNADSYRCHVLDEYGSLSIQGGPREPQHPSLSGMIADGWQLDDDPAPLAPRIELLVFCRYGRVCELQIFRQDGQPIATGLRPNDIEVSPSR